MYFLGVIATIWLPWYFCVFNKSKNKLKIKQS